MYIRYFLFAHCTNKPEAQMRFKPSYNVHQLLTTVLKSVKTILKTIRYLDRHSATKQYNKKIKTNLNLHNTIGDVALTNIG